jgi:hypothetical protein
LHPQDIILLTSGTGMMSEETDKVQLLGITGMGMELIQEVIDLLKEPIALPHREIRHQLMRVTAQAEVTVLLTEVAVPVGAAMAAVHEDKGINMKKLLCVAAIFLFLNVTGCYTVIWSPGMDFPTADDTSGYNSTDSTGYYTGSDNYGGIYGDVYYSEPYYGPYAGYYNIPWWYSIAPPTVSSINNKNNGKTTVNRNGDVSPVRNSGDGRGRSDRNTGDIINTPPVTVSGSGTTTSGSDVKKTDSDSGNRNDNSRQSTNSGSVRNNDGNRNDGGRK